MFVMNLICDKHPLRKKGRATEYSVWGFYNIRDMPKQKKPYVPQWFESEVSFLPKTKKKICAKDASANIYVSMLMSQAWHDLSLKQKELYLYCKAQQFGEHKIEVEHKTNNEIQNNTNLNLLTRFTMNKSKWCEIYHIYSKGGQRHFYADMKALVDNGFIKVVENGKTSRTKNIYEYSDKWKEKGAYKPKEKA